MEAWTGRLPPDQTNELEAFFRNVCGLRERESAPASARGFRMGAAVMRETAEE